MIVDIGGTQHQCDYDWIPTIEHDQTDNGRKTGDVTFTGPAFVSLPSALHGLIGATGFAEFKFSNAYGNDPVALRRLQAAWAEVTRLGTDVLKKTLVDWETEVDAGRAIYVEFAHTKKQADSDAVFRTDAQPLLEAQITAAVTAYSEKLDERKRSGSPTTRAISG